MTDLRALSRRWNKRFRGGHEMVCSRVYRSRCRPLIWALDLLFFLIDGGRDHCLRCYRVDHPPSNALPDRLRRAGLL